jgi:hypothetical protein
MECSANQCFYLSGAKLTLLVGCKLTPACGASVTALGDVMLAIHANADVTNDAL